MPLRPAPWAPKGSRSDQVVQGISERTSGVSADGVPTCNAFQHPNTILQNKAKPKKGVRRESHRMRARGGVKTSWSGRLLPRVCGAVRDFVSFSRRSACAARKRSADSGRGSPTRFGKQSLGRCCTANKGSATGARRTQTAGLCRCPQTAIPASYLQTP
jgi:hypothetical protein